jgi:hypothetical protein
MSLVEIRAEPFAPRPKFAFLTLNGNSTAWTYADKSLLSDRVERDEVIGCDDGSS